MCYKRFMEKLQYETIIGQVVAKANHYLAVPSSDGNGKRIIKDEAIRDYERRFVEQCSKYKNKGIDGSFRLHIKVFHSSRRYDLDNSLKTILDCLQMAHANTDDNLCVGIVADKFIDKYNPRVVYAIEELERRLMFTDNNR